MTGETEKLTLGCLAKHNLAGESYLPHLHHSPCSAAPSRLAFWDNAGSPCPGGKLTNLDGVLALDMICSLV